MIKLDPARYQIKNADKLISPALIYYEEIIRDNIELMIRIAGGADRLWPHVKSHKSLDFVKMTMEYGLSRFKCAIIPEAEMAAKAGAKQAILAYPLVGPNIQRLIDLIKTYPATEFFAIGDDEGQLQLLSDAAEKACVRVNLLLDINDGLDRTGIKTSKAGDLYRKAAKMPGICVRGMHVYDGQRHESDAEDRSGRVFVDVQPVFSLRRKLQAEGLDVGIMVMGGTPSFPCHVKDADETVLSDEKGVYFSPGTCLIQDYGYAENFPDLPFEIGAMLLTRVVSHPSEGVFTVDLGCKAVATDPAIPRAYLAGYEDCTTLMQNEEHWVLKMPEGKEDQRPAIGTELYAAPVHICPTSALYPELLIARKGEIADRWKVTARNRW